MHLYVINNTYINKITIYQIIYKSINKKLLIQQNKIYLGQSKGIIFLLTFIKEFRLQMCSPLSFLMREGNKN